MSVEKVPTLDQRISEWSAAIEAVDSKRIQELYNENPELLWRPLAKDATQDTDYSHLITQLGRIERLGTTLQNLNGLQYLLLDHLETFQGVPSIAHTERTRLIGFFIERARPNDLNKCYWGSSNNTTLHLSSLLGLTHISRQLIDKGALITVSNDLGCLPRDVASNDETTRLLTPPEDKPEEPVVGRLRPRQHVEERVPIPKFSPSERFKQLREKAEESALNDKKNTPVDRQTSTRKYFKPGHVEERKKQVLSEEEEAELEKQRLKRQQEVALLTKRSAVKNNPLLKKFEQQSTENIATVAPKPVPSYTQNKLLALDDGQGDPQFRRKSKMISSLQNKSFVSSSVFRQGEPSDPVLPRSPRQNRMGFSSSYSPSSESEPSSSGQRNTPEGQRNVGIQIQVDEPEPIDQSPRPSYTPSITVQQPKDNLSNIGAVEKSETIPIHKKPTTDQSTVPQSKAVQPEIIITSNNGSGNLPEPNSPADSLTSPEDSPTSRGTRLQDFEYRTTDRLRSKNRNTLARQSLFQGGVATKSSIFNHVAESDPEIERRGGTRNFGSREKDGLDEDEEDEEDDQSSQAVISAKDTESDRNSDRVGTKRDLESKVGTLPLDTNRPQADLEAKTTVSPLKPFSLLESNESKAATDKKNISPLKPFELSESGYSKTDAEKRTISPLKPFGLSEGDHSKTDSEKRTISPLKPFELSESGYSKTDGEERNISPLKPFGMSENDDGKTDDEKRNISKLKPFELSGNDHARTDEERNISKLKPFGLSKDDHARTDEERSISKLKPFGLSEDDHARTNEQRNISKLKPFGLSEDDHTRTDEQRSISKLKPFELPKDERSDNDKRPVSPLRPYELPDSSTLKTENDNKTISPLKRFEPLEIKKETADLNRREISPLQPFGLSKDQETKSDIAEKTISPLGFLESSEIEKSIIKDKETLVSAVNSSSPSDTTLAKDPFRSEKLAELPDSIDDGDFETKKTDSFVKADIPIESAALDTFAASKDLSTVTRGLHLEKPVSDISETKKIVPIIEPFTHQQGNLAEISTSEQYSTTSREILSSKEATSHKESTFKKDAIPNEITAPEKTDDSLQNTTTRSLVTKEDPVSKINVLQTAPESQIDDVSRDNSEHKTRDNLYLSESVVLDKGIASQDDIVPAHNPSVKSIGKDIGSTSSIDNRTLVKNAVLDAFKQNMSFDEDYLSDEDELDQDNVDAHASDKGKNYTDSSSRISAVVDTPQLESKALAVEPENKVYTSRQSRSVDSQDIQSNTPTTIPADIYKYTVEEEHEQESPVSPLDKNVVDKHGLQAVSDTAGMSSKDQKRASVMASPIPTIISKDDLWRDQEVEIQPQEISPADEIEKEKQRLSQTPSAEEMRRLSGSQRSHWSVGMNLWDTVIRRESLRGETDHRQSLTTCSESDSEQWFDSQEEWMLEQAERRKSKRKSRAAAEGEEYISSDDEEATWRPELASRAVAFEGKAEMIDKKELLSKERLVNDDKESVLERESGEKQVEEGAPKVSFDDAAHSMESNSDANSNRRLSEDTIRGTYVHHGVEEHGAVEDKGRFSSDGTSVPSRGPSSSFSSHRRSMGDSLDTSPPHSPQKTSEEVFEREQIQQQSPQIQPERTEEVQRGFGSVSVTTTAHLITPLPKKKDPEEQVEGSTKVELGPEEIFEDHSTPQPRTLSGPVLIQEHDNSPDDAGLSMLVAEAAPEVLPATQQGKLYVRVNGAHNMLLPLPKEVTYVRCVVSDGRYEYMSRYEILGQQVLLDYECIVDTHPDMIVTVALHVRPDYHVKPRTGLSRWFTSIRKQKELLSGYVHPDDGAIGQTRFALPHMMHACYQKSYQSTFDCFNSWYCRSSREKQRQQQFGEEEDVLKVVGNLSIEMLYLPVSDPSLVSGSSL
ncbi:hypothetical protein CLU79DRAFT_513855 [Phycomyces nitens]|nr:hypothetical protein CLU79DRAFT_513855 [Phycomyces nitens]